MLRFFDKDMSLTRAPAYMKSYISFHLTFLYFLDPYHVSSLIWLANLWFTSFTLVTLFLIFVRCIFLSNNGPAWSDWLIFSPWRQRFCSWNHLQYNPYYVVISQSTCSFVYLSFHVETLWKLRSFSNKDQSLRGIKVEPSWTFRIKWGTTTDSVKKSLKLSAIASGVKKIWQTQTNSKCRLITHLVPST